MRFTFGFVFGAIFGGCVILFAVAGARLGDEFIAKAVLITCIIVVLIWATVAALFVRLRIPVRSSIPAIQVITGEVVVTGRTLARRTR